jgi:hypothetical protein
VKQGCSLRKLLKELDKNIWLEGYDTTIDIKDGASLANVIFDGVAASTPANYKTRT